MRSLVVIALLGLSIQAAGQTMYKCQIDGKIQYTDRPCTSGVEVKRMAPNGGPTPEDRARAQMRVKAELQRFDEQERADAAARARQAAEQRARRAREATASAESDRARFENERVTTHGPDGWDRKPRGQVEAEQRAKAAGRAAAVAGADVPIVPESSSMKANGWQNEKVMDHDSRGWTERTRGELVQWKANRAYEDTKNPFIASCNPGGCIDSDGHFYSGGPVAYTSQDGRTCTRAGTMLNCD